MKTEINFANLFENMKDYMLSGIYQSIYGKRSKKDVELEEKCFGKAASIGSLLNSVFDLKRTGKSLPDDLEWQKDHFLPQTEWEIRCMLEYSQMDILSDLPEDFLHALKENENTKLLCYTDSIIERDEYYDTIRFTDDGNNLLYYSRIMEAVSDKIPFGSMLQNEIYLDMKAEDYVRKRHFIIHTKNLCIPVNMEHWSEEQITFINEQFDFFEKCYERMEAPFYLCRKCGKILTEKEKITHRCDRSREAIKADDSIIYVSEPCFVLKYIIRKCIYYPGGLELDIESFLEKARCEGKIVSFDIWPGNASLEHDVWDFDVILNDGRHIVLDAKIVENPNYIIKDKRCLKEHADFVYIVPSSQKKSYIDQINSSTEFQSDEHLKCLTFRDFCKLLNERGGI